LVLFFLLVLAACTSKKSDFMYIPQGFLAIEQARKNKPIDFAVINDQYRQQLQSFIAGSNSAAHQEIVNAINQGMNKKQPHIQSQVVSKVLQLVFYRELVKSLDHLLQAKDPAVCQQEYVKVSALYQALSPLVTRRGEWIGQGQALDQACLLLLPDLQSFPPDDKARAAAQSLREVLRNAYVLSVYYELEGIEKARGADIPKCEEKQTEAILFFRAVADQAANDSLRQVLAAALERPFTEMDIPLMRTQLRIAFPYTNELMDNKNTP
jgi:hypothetical protein